MKGFGSSDNGKVCLRNPRKKMAGTFNCDLQAYVIQLRVLVIAMNALVTRLLIYIYKSAC